MDKLILKSKLTDEQQDFLGNILDSDLYENWVYYDESEVNEDIKSTVEARGRKSLYLNEVDNEELHSTLKEIEKELFELNGFDKSKFKLIGSRKSDGLYPTMLSCIYKKDNFPNHGIHTHKDWRGPNGEMQVRFNYLVRKAEEGGEPVINRRIVDLQEKEGMVLFASEWLHAGMPVDGDKTRILLSFGYLVEKEYAQELEKRFNYGTI